MERIDPQEEQHITAVLQAHHKATATKDASLLREVFASWGQFVGTDDTEQWTRDEYVTCLESTESGWDMMECRERSIYSIFPRINEESAMFFEVVHHATYGLMRGSGVVFKDSSVGWQIVQYVLSFSVPNHAVDDTNLLELLAT